MLVKCGHSLMQVFPLFGLLLIEVFGPYNLVDNRAVTHAEPCRKATLSLGQLYYARASATVGVGRLATRKLAVAQQDAVPWGYVIVHVVVPNERAHHVAGLKHGGEHTRVDCR